VTFNVCDWDSPTAKQSAAESGAPESATEGTVKAPGPEYRNWIVEEPKLAALFHDQERGFLFACKALELARETLFYLTKERNPRLHERMGPYSPLMVKCDRTELAWATRDFQDACDLPREMEDLAFLRNFIAHPGAAELAVVDRKVRCAETFIKAAGDEARLQQLRDARDALRDEAVAIVEEVEERKLLAELTGEDGYKGAGVWDRKHLDLFKTVNNGLYGEIGTELRDAYSPPVVLRAAERWGRAPKPAIDEW
jgi:hypothetical protein